MTGRRVIVAFGLVLGTWWALTSPAAAEECALGWYAIDGDAVLESGTDGAVRAPHSIGTGSSHGRVVSLVGDEVAIEGLCSPTVARVKHKRRRTKIKATWDDCDGIDGPVKLRATIDADGCASMRGVVKARRAKPKKTRFVATRSLGDPRDCSEEDTFTVLQKQIFGAKGCRISTCHGEFKSGGLDLRYGAAHFALVDQPATTPGASGKMRVVPGDPDVSFLYQKLAGTLGAGEGERMPAAGSPPLDALELEFVRAWIEAGAPAVGRVDTAPCLPHPTFEPAKPLDPPPGGHQLVVEGPILQPGEEIEGCMWVRLPTSEDFAVGAWEYSMNPGTHHFAVWDHVRGAEPATGVFSEDLACFGGGAPIDGRSISGAGEAPYFVDDYPAGTGRVLEAGKLLGLNPHYFNEFDVPIQVKVWINLHPVAGALQHEVETLFSGFASFEGNTAYGISVPPFSTGTLRLRMTNPLGRPMSIFEMSSHQHQRGVRFTAWNSSGEKIFENFDWAHPAVLDFDEPMVLAADDWIDFECEWDNGVTREVRRCGDSPNDVNCTPGDPMTVTFGVTAQDEMCFLTGYYYAD